MASASRLRMRGHAVSSKEQMRTPWTLNENADSLVNVVRREPKHCKLNLSKASFALRVSIGPNRLGTCTSEQCRSRLPQREMLMPLEWCPSFMTASEKAVLSKSESSQTQTPRHESRRTPWFLVVFYMSCNRRPILNCKYF